MSTSNNPKRQVSTTTSGTDRSKDSKEPVKPRLSASLLLVNSKNEVLMIQRTKESRTFAGMHAFPGGNYDPKQDGAPTDPRLTAVRETFEETGILLASPSSTTSSWPATSVISQGRKSVHSREDPTTFPDFLNRNGLSIANTLPNLIPFSQWVTPVTAKSRFWTWFYVGFVEELRQGIPADGSSIDALIPQSDNQIEIFDAYFKHPTDILDSFSRGEISIMPPQFYLLTVLSELLEKGPIQDSSYLAQRSEKIRRTSDGGFGGRAFNPRFGGKITGADGVERAILMYEGDEDYDRGTGKPQPAEKGTSSLGQGQRRRHRSLVEFKAGVSLVFSLRQ
ncbi:hypothetical protein CPB86DRAFT_703740 [Serendipita vermifera]|nr:hypothetical protein CPB86DRAFT_703740 [Serendipita vermifera]